MLSKQRKRSKKFRKVYRTKNAVDKFFLREMQYQELMRPALRARSLAKRFFIKNAFENKIPNYSIILPLMLAFDNVVVQESKQIAKRTGFSPKSGQNFLRLIPVKEVEKQIEASAIARAEVSKRPVRIEVENILHQISQNENEIRRRLIPESKIPTQRV